MALIFDRLAFAVGENKVYVTHRLREDKAMISRLILEDGGYLCVYMRGRKPHGKGCIGGSTRDHCGVRLCRRSIGGSGLHKGNENKAKIFAGYLVMRNISLRFLSM